MKRENHPTSMCFGEVDYLADEARAASVRSLRLIYQRVPPDRSDDAFASALQAVASGSKALSIASPYLSHSILEPLTRGRSFRLITDWRECLDGGVDERLEAWIFAHADAIRDLPGLHAKVVVGDRKALFGSANLTTMGLTRRFEMACLVEEKERDELFAWIDAIWKQGSPVDLALLKGPSRRRRGADAGIARRAGWKLKPTGRLSGIFSEKSSPRTSDQKAQDEPNAPAKRVDRAANDSSSGVRSPHTASQEEIDGLARQLRRLTPNRSIASAVLGYFDHAFDFLDLDPSDERLHLNFGQRPPSITVGQRNVVWAKFRARRPVLGFILDDFALAKEFAERDPHVSWNAFRKRGAHDCPSFYWPIEEAEAIPARIIQSWERAMRQEVLRAGTSRHVSKKRAALYPLSRDSSLRAEVVRRAHPMGWWFGVNNGGGKGHRHFSDIEPLLEGRAIEWPFAHSKRLPPDAYRLMLPGDDVLLWTGHGTNPAWGLIGTAQIAEIGSDRLILHRGRRFVKPLTPYPQGAPRATRTFRFLMSAFGEDFLPLGDVSRAVLGTKRVRPITVAAVEMRVLRKVLRRVEESAHHP